VTDPRDEIDDWLEAEIQPLAPPPGMFERIHRRARRRKARQAVLTVAAAAVVITAAALAPQLAGGLLHSSPGRGHHQVALSSPSPPRSRTPSRKASPNSRSARRTRNTTGLSRTTSGTLPPANFRPTSITMIGEGIGAVIGQAGQAGSPCATQFCTSLAGTSSWGASWYGVSAPLTSGPDGSRGVSQLRFLNLSDGWAFGPQLWMTRDGGRNWHREQTHGLRVTDLEASRSRAFAVLARCAGTGSDYAGDCTSFRLYTSTAGSMSWHPVRVPAGYEPMATGLLSAQASSASLAIASGTQTGYLLTPSGTVLSGSVNGGPWTVSSTAPCTPGRAQSDGQPSQAQLAAGPALLLACDQPAHGSSQGKTLYEFDSGQWQPAGMPPSGGIATSLTSASGGQVLLATSTGIEYSGDSGKTWQQATVTGGTPRGGFSYIGMTDPTHGVAVPADAELGEVFVTETGGQTWSASPITGN
jgi:hypothetical protein